jgi:hypothetical protein
MDRTSSLRSSVVRSVDILKTNYREYDKGKISKLHDLAATFNSFLVKYLEYLFQDLTNQLKYENPINLILTFHYCTTVISDLN